ncbi:hypothetical protein AX14_002804 [Amanita brunnescens Koide BX004]|nr:hypothetical protein AX14_002804 [Amanita brunnescens Koide BX004]
MSSSTYFSDLQASIISACTEHERDNGRKPDYSRAFPFHGYFIKFGPHSTFDPAVMTLKYLAGLTTNDSSAPRVPQVLHYFYQHGGMAYVVMELIQFDQVSPEILAERAAQAVRWMRNMRAPDDLVLGPKGRGPACHVVFKDSEAPQNYRSVKALERYFNKAVKIVRQLQSKNIPDVNIANEPLVLTSGNIGPELAPKWRADTRSVDTFI